MANPYLNQMTNQAYQGEIPIQDAVQPASLQQRLAAAVASLHAVAEQASELADLLTGTTPAKPGAASAMPEPMGLFGWASMTANQVEHLSEDIASELQRIRRVAGV